MKTTQKLFILLSLIAMLLIGCSKNNDQPEKPPKYSVYVSGFYGDVACYWKDGKRTDLAFLDYTLRYNPYVSIAVSDGKIYTAGRYRYEITQTNIACYWVDGQRVDLAIPEDGNNTIAYSIVVSGNNVYVSGKCDSYPCYWINGKMTTIQINADIQNKSIAVSDDKVYLIGNYYTANGNIRSSFYTVDDELRILPVPNGIFYSFASSIAVAGGKVYVAGVYSKYYSSPNISCYWIDGARTDLEVPNETIKSSASSITASNGKVYVAGGYNNGTNYIACYWINGVRYDLELSNETTNSYANSIAVADGKVYITGQCFRGNNNVAFQWVDGKCTYLTVPDKDAVGTSIAVI